jgi:hypothetical protein
MLEHVKGGKLPSCSGNRPQPVPKFKSTTESGKLPDTILGFLDRCILQITILAALIYINLAVLR